MKIKPLLILLAFAAIPRLLGAQADGFSEFWKRFQAAVVKGDKEAVASMTHLPYFYVGGFLDRNGFLQKYGEIFEKREKACVAKGRPEKDDLGNYAVFCGPMIFSFSPVEGEYKFMDIGSND